MSLGIQYTPANVNIGTLLIDVQDLDAFGVEFVRIQWVDLINNIRFRIVPLSHFKKLMASPRPSISVTKFVFGIVFDEGAPGFAPSGEYLYVPEFDTLRICKYAPGHAVVFGRFEEKVPIPDPRGVMSLTVPLCPRTTLRRIVEDAKRTLGVEFLVGVETEFILLKSTDPIVAANSYGWSNSPATATGKPETMALEEMAKALITSGIELQMYHAEAAPGQYEIITGPLSPLEAADALIHTRETIFNVASKHGFRATLAPRVYMQSCGSAAHTHISVHNTGHKNVPLPPSPDPDNLSPLEASFLAGLLAHLPAIVAFTLPLPASYLRMQDGVWSGGTYVCWGVDNREAPVRLCNAPSPSSRNFEIKCADGTSSPYLAIASLLAGGISGIVEGKTLEEKNVIGLKSAAQMNEDERKAFGVSTKLPLTWKSARENLAKDDALKKLIGEQMIDTYLRVNKTLADAMAEETEEKTLRKLVENF